MDGQEQWQLTGQAPALYQRDLVPTVTARWAADLMAQATLTPGERVLDVACGTGVVARLAAGVVGRRGRVAALDLNPGMLTVARALPPVCGAAISWHEGSMLALPFPDATFDVVLCQLGLQFVPDRPRALREMRRVLVPAGRLALNVFGPLEHNPAPQALVTALERQLGPGAARAKRTEHALADAAALQGLVAAAGFGGVVIRTATKRVQFASVGDYVRIQLAATPLALLLGAASVPGSGDVGWPERVVAAVSAEVGAALAPYVGEEGLSVPQEVHSVLARS